MLVTLSQASKLDGSPSQPALFKMTKKQPPPAFLASTEKGWRVDTESGAWKVYLAGTSRKGTPQKLVGNETKRITDKAREKKPTAPQDDDEGKSAVTLERAYEAKVIWDSQLTKQKLFQAEIKTNQLKGVFVEKLEAKYWFTFLQRGMNDSFASVKRSIPELKRLFSLGDDLGAEKYLMGDMKRGFEMAVAAANETIAGEIADDGN
jgi:hypothetical protein